MDLFTPVVPESRFHPNFVNSLHPAAEGSRAVLSSWAADFPDRDGKFVKEFQTTFNSAFWELYLHAAWRELGLAVDYSYHAPDFLSQGPVAFTAEAVIANESQGHAPEWALDVERINESVNERDELIRIATIRLSNAICSKYARFKESYANLEHVKRRPFVICVAPFEQPGSFLQGARAILRVLYGFDRLVTANSSEGPVVFAESWMPEILKDNGANIPLGLFARPAMPEVSAVVFSHTATYSKLHALDPARDVLNLFEAYRYDASSGGYRQMVTRGRDYVETVLDGLHVLVNPFATLPLDVSFFEGREVAIHSFDLASNRLISKVPDGFLRSRSCCKLLVVNELTSVDDARRPKRVYARPVRAAWPDGQLHKVESRDFLFQDHHLAHFQGWTIHVARDIEDGDWVGRGVQRICFSTGEVASAAAAGVEDVIASGVYPSAGIAMYATAAEIMQHLAVSERGP